MPAQSVQSLIVVEIQLHDRNCSIPVNRPFNVVNNGEVIPRNFNVVEQVVCVKHVVNSWKKIAFNVETLDR